MYQTPQDSQTRWTRILIAVITAVALSGSMGLAQQQQQQQQPPPPSQPELVESDEVPDAELERFILVIRDVGEIQQALAQQLATVQEPAEAQKLQQEANNRMVTIIKACELEVDRYNSIARSISADAELAQRFQALNKELLASDEEPESCDPGGSRASH